MISFKFKTFNLSKLDLGFNKSIKLNLNILRFFYIFIAKRWYINLIYNRYVASLGFYLGYNDTFILLDIAF